MKHQNALFSRFGVELEYMIVDASTLDVQPAADDLLHHFGGTFDDLVRGGMEWSNELARHVIELKTGKPVARLAGLANSFQSEVEAINRHLAHRGLCLLPTAMHPWMDPHRETKLWPHGYQDVYKAFHRIFDCRGHGWGNLQSVHLNLPYANEDEFVRLHTAIRLLLPLIPALSASSPITDGNLAPNLDNRLDVYRFNCKRIPSVTGRVIPEPIRSIPEYHRRILNRIYRALKPHDIEGILRHEWANARGAIARFDRNTIEIRVIDIQECPAADSAILESIIAVLRRLTDQSISDPEQQIAPRTPDLERIFLDVVKSADSAVIRHRGFLDALGFQAERSLLAKEVWTGLLEKFTAKRVASRAPITTILKRGCLSRRILEATGPRPNRAKLKDVYLELAECLAGGRQFLAG